MLRPGQSVILCALALLTLGVVMVNSASMAVDPIDVEAGSLHAETAQSVMTRSGVTFESILLSRSTVFMVIALAAMGLASFLPVRALAHRLEASPRIGRLGEVGWLALGTLLILGVLALVYIPGMSRVVNGSARWISLPIPGLDSVQPSEIAKWAIIPLLAIYAARRARDPGMHRFLRGLAPAIVALGLVAGFVVLEDLGTGALIAMAGAILLLASGARFWHFAMFVPPALGGVALAIWQSPYRLQRIITFIDPYADPQGSGYHMIQSMSTVAGGGLFGRGLGHGLQKFGYLPEDTTDFLFAIICEELGLAGALLVISLYAIMIWNALAIVRGASLLSLKLVGLGVTGTVALQAVINMVVVTGLGPTKGIALPLLSSGGTGWILTGAMLGLLVSIDRASTVDEPLDAEAPEISVRARMPRPDSPESAPEPSEPAPQAEEEEEASPQTEPEPVEVVVKPRVRLSVGEA
ncbi:MAG: FtsW/RodA/SpoVE family cell cycle protein [Phycisphaerales bacterium JB059]